MKIYLEIDSVWMVMHIDKEDLVKKYRFHQIISPSSFQSLMEAILTPKEFKKYCSGGQDFSGYISKKRYELFIIEMKKQLEIFNHKIEDL